MEYIHDSKNAPLSQTVMIWFKTRCNLERSVVEWDIFFDILDRYDDLIILSSFCQSYALSSLYKSHVCIFIFYNNHDF